MSKFEELLAKNVNDKTEKRKNGKVELTYLSWAWAWAEFKKFYPDATYEIKKFETNGKLLPYMYEEDTGYMVQTCVTADGLTYEMWLPVMDGANKSMKNKSYEYETKYGEKKKVEQASMFDVNKSIMRCLTKNLAMFGLGLYIYAGEDLPEGEEQPIKTVEVQKEEYKCKVCGKVISQGAYKNWNGLCADCKKKGVKDDEISE